MQELVPHESHLTYPLANFENFTELIYALYI